MNGPARVAATCARRPLPPVARTCTPRSPASAIARSTPRRVYGSSSSSHSSLGWTGSVKGRVTAVSFDAGFDEAGCCCCPVCSLRSLGSHLELTAPRTTSTPCSSAQLSVLSLLSAVTYLSLAQRVELDAPPARKVGLTDTVKLISAKEVMRHTTEDDAWVIIHDPATGMDKVWDVTEVSSAPPTCPVGTHALRLTTAVFPALPVPRAAPRRRRRDRRKQRTRRDVSSASRTGTVPSPARPLNHPLCPPLQQDLCACPP